MRDNHWAIFALRDIRNALNSNEYDHAVVHIDDAISAIRRSGQMRSIASVGVEQCSGDNCMCKS